MILVLRARISDKSLNKISCLTKAGSKFSARSVFSTNTMYSGNQRKPKDGELEIRNIGSATHRGERKSSFFIFVIIDCRMGIELSLLRSLSNILQLHWNTK